MLDCVDIANDQNSLTLTKSQESDLSSNYNAKEQIETKQEEQVNPAPNFEQPSARPLDEYYDQYDDFKIRIGDEYQIDLSDYNRRIFLLKLIFYFYFYYLIKSCKKLQI